MAEVALRRMSGVVRAKLPPRLRVQAPGGLQRPRILTLLLASATVSSGKGGAAAGRLRGARRTGARTRRRAEPGKGRFRVDGAI